MTGNHAPISVRGLTKIFHDESRGELRAVDGIDVGIDQRIGIAGIQFVAGNLLLQESIVRFVRIEGIDYVVAIAPDVRPRFIGFKSVRIGVTCDIVFRSDQWVSERSRA